MKMRKWLAFVAALLILTVSVLPAIAKGDAAGWTVREGIDPSFAAYLKDDAGLLTDQEGVLKALSRVTEYTNAAFCTTASIGEYRTTEEFAAETAYSLFDYDGGVIFVIDMENRWLQIYACDGIENVITPTVADTITDNIYRFASSENYDKCAVKAFEQIYRKFSGQMIPQTMKLVGNALLALMIGFGISVFWALSSSQIKPKKQAATVAAAVAVSAAATTLLSRERIYHSSSSSGGHSGGGHSGGGGGHSGGGGGHGF